MEQPPRVLILDEPTRGVDVGAREEMFRDHRAGWWPGGMAVLLISSDLPEVHEPLPSPRPLSRRPHRARGRRRRLHAGAGDGRTHGPHNTDENTSAVPAAAGRDRPAVGDLHVLGPAEPLPHGGATCSNLAQQISVNAILAFGMTLVILIGGIDLSAWARWWPWWARSALRLLRTSPCAAARTGRGAGRGRRAWALSMACVQQRRAMPPFIITLATMLVARGAGAAASTRGGRLPIARTRRSSSRWATAGCGDWLPVPVVVMVAVFAVTAVLLHRTRFGQHLYAIGGNREAARFTGIAVARHEVAVYALCGLYAGLAGHDPCLATLLRRARRRDKGSN